MVIKNPKMKPVQHIAPPQTPDETEDNVIPDNNPRVAAWAKKAKLGVAYKRAPKQEQETAQRLTGGRQIPASGARFRKADVEVVGLCRVECKATAAKSFSITQDMLQKVENAGMLNDQIPYVEVEFVNQVGKVTGSACVLSRHALTYLMNRLADAEGITPTDRRSVRLDERRNGKPTKKFR